MNSLRGATRTNLTVARAKDSKGGRIHCDEFQMQGEPMFVPIARSKRLSLSQEIEHHIEHIRSRNETRTTLVKE